MKDKKLRPVSEELVNKIINQDAVPSSYGCGCGSGCGCGCGSGDGSGSGENSQDVFFNKQYEEVQVWDNGINAKYGSGYKTFYAYFNANLRVYYDTEKSIICGDGHMFASLSDKP